MWSASKLQQQLVPITPPYLTYKFQMSRNLTELYRAIHIYKRGKSLKKLWCCFGGVTSFNNLVLYRAIHNYTGLYTAIQGYTELYTAVLGYIQLYRALQTYTRPYTAIQRYKQLYRAIHNYIELYIAVQGNT